MKIITIIGARPQFIKAAPISRELRKNHQELIIHTGQHYDENMSKIFFDELHIPKPDFNLGVGSGNHGEQTGKMLIEIEKILVEENPDFLLVYGDTNSTLAGALAAAKIHIPVIHIEAGLRSFNKNMPEEINRIMTDHVSEYLFCPTETAIGNLKNENIRNNVYNVGDVMYDAVLYNRDIAESKSDILRKNSLTKKQYHLITIHRAENTDSESKLKNILYALSQINETKVWPLHPRTKSKLNEYNLNLEDIPNLIVIDPIGYLDMLKLVKNAKKVITDSGGVQKEAYFLQVPCITIREQTEWVETLKDEANILTGTDPNLIIESIKKDNTPHYYSFFGEGDTSKKIVNILESGK
jgi:UDP-GlcNAc3NAcA epimerase